jgi:hypothetical protein
MPQAPVLQEIERLTSVVDKVVGWVHHYRPLKLAVKTAESAVSGIATVGSFPGGKEAGAWRYQPLPSSAEVIEIVELYLYSPFLRFTAGSHM